MYLLIDSASNNVLAEFDSFHDAEQRRIQVVGMNPALAEYIEVVDLDRTVQADRARTRRGERESAEAQPA